MKIFIICPVRNLQPSEAEVITKYISKLEKEGNQVHYPPRDTNQDDSIGWNICMQNKLAIEEADEIHIYYNPESSGTLFDMGMAFALKKKIKLINEVEATNGKKSFNNVLRKWSSL